MRTLLILGTLLLPIASLSADQTVNTGIPGGDGKALLDSPVDPDNGGGAIIRDIECGKKTKTGPRLANGKLNPDYARCVHDKLEKAKKKSDH